MKPKITFGVIVVNGEPFTKYCLRSIYPYAHEIIVVEGGHEDAFAVTTSDGHSIDGTLNALHEFKKEEDPENKIQIVTRNSHWRKTDEFGRCRTHQSRAYAERATGDYLWQVDIDEFYRPKDIEAIIKLVMEKPNIMQISFYQYSFWGSINYLSDGWALRRSKGWHRIFKWGEGYKYLTHEPPTVIDADGNNVNTGLRITAQQMNAMNIRLYHYSLLFPLQVRNKIDIYKHEKPLLFQGIQNWAENSYYTLNDPYHVHNLYTFPSWIERFRGEHPPEVYKMIEDVSAGKYKDIEIRINTDVERLLSSFWYPCGRFILKYTDYIERFARKTKQLLWTGTEK